MTAHDETTRGIWATTAAFVTWGFVPVYWKAVSDLPAEEMIVYRIAWALPFISLLLVWTKGWAQVRSTFRRPRLLLVMGLGASLIGFNWFIFIEAMNNDQVMQASLGYYINPLVNVLLGFMLLGERMRRLQWMAIAMATAGVVNLVVAAGELPLISLALAFSFGLYGLVRKLAPIDALPGLFIEVLWMTPLAMLWLGVHIFSGPGMTEVGSSTLALVPLAGVITTLPLSWFSYGARRLPLATVGILQFIAPTGHFFLAILAYGEPFERAQAITFALIWLGVLLYVLDLIRTRRRDRLHA
jgi:chloramphenicol-sensitive protein RarD